ncbi:TPA: hypothetical protein VGT17_005206 [Vibrio harveyi]|nr:hypothetical protein [Vibrio harveyi]HEQ3599238.1 hypothetical protein [Vibrio harveyi]HEQ3611296.1 hypothetical protein [Vibrio harveyi]
MSRYDDFSTTGYERDVLCEITGIPSMDAPTHCDELSVSEWESLKAEVQRTAKLWKVIDECATFLGKRNLQDSMYSEDFVEFAGLSGEINEFEGDILAALQSSEANARCRKMQVKARHAALLAQSEQTQDIPHYRVEFIRGDMRSQDEIEQLDRIEVLNEVTGVKK